MVESIILMHFPVVLLLAFLSLEAASAFQLTPFIWVAIGWFANFAYLLAFRYLHDTNIGIYLAQVVTPLALVSGGAFWAAAHRFSHDNPLALRFLSPLQFGIALVVIAFWVQFATSRFGTTFPGGLWAAIPSALFAAASLYALFTFLSAFSETYARRAINTPLACGALLYVALQLIYPFSLTGVWASEIVVIAGFSSGLFAKALICVGLFKLVSDALSEARASEAELQQERKTIATITHELGTPVAEMMLHVMTLRGERTKRGRSLALLEGALHRIEAIMEATKDLHMVEEALGANGKAATVLREVQVENINKVIMIAVMAIKRTRDEDVKISPQLTARCCIQCVPHEIVQVFINLLRNSCDAFPLGKGNITLRTSTESGGRASEGQTGIMRVIITDDGEGIAPDKRELVFHRGFSTRGGPGRGHGLAVVRDLVERNGGRVSLSEAQPGTRGARFQLEFPRVSCKGVQNG